MKIALAQIAPKLLDRAATTTKIVQRISEAADCGCQLIAFGESLLPAYPVWLLRTGEAKFDDPDQKRLHAMHLDPAGYYARPDVVRRVVDRTRQQPVERMESNTDNRS